MVGFVDSVVLIDVMRGYTPAIEWIAGQQNLAICPLVYMELMDGSQNKRAQTIARNIASDYDMIYLTPADMAWAMQYHAAYRLSHGIGIIDCLIASVSARLQLPLYTRNLKHFVPLLGDLAISPY